MSEILKRQWTIIQYIPRLPRYITARKLLEILIDEEYEVKKRTVERDLLTLSKVLPIFHNNTPTGFQWYWMNDKIFEIPSMSAHTALTLSFVSDYLKPFFPKSSLEYLNPYFERASKVLKDYGTPSIKSWKNKVRVIRNGLSLKPCETKTEVLENVYDALLYNKKFYALYISREGETKEYEVNPLGLVFKESVIYLVCTINKYKDIRQLALHRIQSATVLDDKLTVPTGFNIDEYISAGNFSYTVKSTPVKIELMFDSFAAKHLMETKLSDDQEIVELSNNYTHLKATVLDTQALRWWILGFGDQVEVIKPKKLRKEFMEITKNMQKMYLGAS